jgi:phosphoenolpyruvate---glycerone phosphotransferase subunit DhaL
MVTKEQVIKWLTLTAKVIEENKEHLTELDAAIGDAEHGISMARGFQKVAGQLPALADKDIGTILKSAGATFLSATGGAGGTIFATFFMEAGKAVSGKTELDTADLAAALRAGLAGVVKRGGAQPGDKTMLDSLAPAVAAFDRALSDGANTTSAMAQTVAAAKQGMVDTTGMIAKKGRASYLGERSIGHQDPGATSMYLILKALYDVVAA